MSFGREIWLRGSDDRVDYVTDMEGVELFRKRK